MEVIELKPALTKIYSQDCFKLGIIMRSVEAVKRAFDDLVISYLYDHLYLCFIDYSKAFDKVRHEKLFNILEHLDIDGKDLRVIRNLYWDQSAAVRIGGELSEYKLIKRGVRQGCVVSPDLFNIYSEMILGNLENYPGVKINGENINNIRYADDTVLIADSEENLQRLLDITIEKSEEMGLTLNVKKTECMVISKKKKQ